MHVLLRYNNRSGPNSETPESYIYGSSFASRLKTEDTRKFVFDRGAGVVPSFKSNPELSLSDVYVNITWNIMNNTTRRHVDTPTRAQCRFTGTTHSKCSVEYSVGRLTTKKQTHSRCVTIQARGSRKRKRTRLLQA